MGTLETWNTPCMNTHKILGIKCIMHGNTLINYSANNTLRLSYIIYHCVFNAWNLLNNMSVINYMICLWANNACSSWANHRSGLASPTSESRVCASSTSCKRGSTLISRNGRAQANLARGWGDLNIRKTYFRINNNSDVVSEYYINIMCISLRKCKQNTWA